MTPRAIQPGEHSTGSGSDGILHTDDGVSVTVWQNSNGNRYVPYLNRNGSNRKLNLNWIDNDWNDICRFAAVRNWLHCEYPPRSLGWIIVPQLFAPAPEHLADLDQRRGQ